MPFKRIIVGVEFSAASLSAARWVAQLAPDAEIVLTHVLPSPEAPAFVQPYMASMLEVISDLEPALRGGLRGLGDLIDPERVHVQLLAGTPADGLAIAAAQLDADLVCIGRMRGRRGGARFGATTAHRLLASTSAPVVVVPAGPSPAPSRLLVAVDDRPSSGAILRRASSMASAWEAAVGAVHVLDPALRDLVRACRHLDLQEHRDAARPSGAPAGLPRLVDEAHLVRIAEEWVANTLEAAGVPRTRATANVRIGDAGQEILACADAGKADMIVIGRGGDRARRFAGHAGGGSRADTRALGSTARMVLWAAPCPVLLLPADQSPRGPDRPPRRRSALRVPSGRSSPELDPMTDRSQPPPAAERRSSPVAARSTLRLRHDTTLEK